MSECKTSGGWSEMGYGHSCRHFPCPICFTPNYTRHTPGARPELLTVILNDTTQTIVPKGLPARGYTHSYPPIHPRANWKLPYYPEERYKEFIVAQDFGGRSDPLVFTTDDLRIASEITIYETPQNALEWRISKARRLAPRDNGKIRELSTFNVMRKDASSKMELIATSCEVLGSLSDQAKVCRAQCTNLVQYCVKGVAKLKKTYFDPSMLNETKMWLLYHNSLKLKQLLSSLETLLSTLGDCKDLVKDCDEGWIRMALALSIPMKSTQYSKFDLLLDELCWNVDKIQYILRGNVELNWSETCCRYAIERTLSVDSERLSIADREGFLSQLHDWKKSWLQEEKFEIGEMMVQERIAAVVETRLHEVSYLSTSCNAIPDSFWVNPKDLILRKRLSAGGYKTIYTGEWLQQEVVIAIMEDYDNLREIIEKEALVMLKVQHPNIVDFFACAFTDKACVWRDGMEENLPRGYLVMEYMPEDLWRLRLRLQLHPAVAVDILQQIVEAMINMHSCGIMHRDLKAANCLVSPRKAVVEPNLCYYTVKLIDFGTSKVFDDAVSGAKHTVNQGTRRHMAPEVWGPPQSGVAEYTKKADVFSFGMTCYEVITGLMPLHEYPTSRVLLALNEGKRPTIPASEVCYPEGLQVLMAKCWAQNPNHRPDFEEIRKDLWTIKYTLELQ